LVALGTGWQQCVGVCGLHSLFRRRCSVQPCTLHLYQLLLVAVLVVEKRGVLVVDTIAHRCTVHPSSAGGSHTIPVGNIPGPTPERTPAVLRCLPVACRLSAAGPCCFRHPAATAGSACWPEDCCSAVRGGGLSSRGRGSAGRAGRWGRQQHAAAAGRPRLLGQALCCACLTLDTPCPAQ
jgi:hypothetical protein